MFKDWYSFSEQNNDVIDNSGVTDANAYNRVTDAQSDAFETTATKQHRDIRCTDTKWRKVYEDTSLSLRQMWHLRTFASPPRSSKYKFETSLDIVQTYRQKYKRKIVSIDDGVRQLSRQVVE